MWGSKKNQPDEYVEMISGERQRIKEYAQTQYALARKLGEGNKYSEATAVVDRAIAALKSEKADFRAEKPRLDLVARQARHDNYSSGRLVGALTGNGKFGKAFRSGQARGRSRNSLELSQQLFVWKREIDTAVLEADGYIASFFSLKSDIATRRRQNR